MLNTGEREREKERDGKRERLTETTKWISRVKNSG